MSGISAQYADGLELRIKELGEQVEKLTKERDAEIARNRPLQSLIKSTEKTKSFLLKKSEENKEAVKQLDSERQANALLTEELAALAEQNEKMKDALKTVVDDAEECTDHDDWTAMLLSLEAYHIASTCLEEIDELPDLASPVLNRIRADGMRRASTFISLVRNDWASAGDNLSVQAAEYLISALDARADELEKNNAM